MPNKLGPEAEMSRRTRRGFMSLGAGAVVAAADASVATADSVAAAAPPHAATLKTTTMLSKNTNTNLRFVDFITLPSN